MGNDDDELFGLRLVDPQPMGKPPEDDRIWLLTGDSWSVWRDGEVYMMEYQSGELQGDLRAIAIEEDDFASLQDGTMSCDAVLRRHHAS